MLFLVTRAVFASLLIACSFQQEPNVPSAHLEGGVPAATMYVKDQVLTAWNPGDANSHVMFGFEYGNGRLSVPRDGRYYVYAQTYFNARPHDTANRVAVFANNRLLFLIHVDMTVNQEQTGSAGGVFLLTAGDNINVKPVGYDTKMWLGASASYFGAYKI